MLMQIIPLALVKQVDLILSFTADQNVHPFLTAWPFKYQFSDSWHVYWGTRIQFMAYQRLHC